MALTIPDSFSKNSIKHNWLVQLYNSDHVEGVTTSAFLPLSFYSTSVSSVKYVGCINNIPSIRENIDLKSSKASTSNVSISCNDTKSFYGGSGLNISQHLYGGSVKYLNRTVKIYIQPNDVTSLSDCLLIYTGKLVNVSHDLGKVNLSITAQRPWDGIEIPQTKTSKNLYYPVAYGDYRPNASTSNADSTAINVTTSSSTDEFRLRKTLYPIPINEIKGETVYALTGEWSQTAKAWGHYYEKSLDKFIPLANHASTASTVDTANESYKDGYAIRFHKNLLKTTLFKPVERVSSGTGWASNDNAFNSDTVDTSSSSNFTLSNQTFTDDNTADIKFSMPQITGVPTSLRVYAVISGDATHVKLAGVYGENRLEIINYTFDNEDIIADWRFDQNRADYTTINTGGSTASSSSAVMVSSGDSVHSNWLSSSSGWGQDLIIRIKEESISTVASAQWSLNVNLFDIVVEATTKLDYSVTTTSGKSEAASFLDGIDYIYSGGDGYTDNGWNSNSAITEVHEAHRDLLHRFTSYTNSNTPTNWGSGTNINSIKDWKCRYWLNEPILLKDALEELQENGQFIFRFNGQGNGVYVFIPDSISTAHTLNTNDIENINISLTPMSDIIARMDIEYEKHPANSGYISKVEASNSTSITDFAIGTNENKKTVRLNALVSAPASTPASNPNDDYYTYKNNLFGVQKILVSATIVNPEYYGIDVGDFVAFDTMPINPFGEDWDDKDFIVTEVQRTLGKLSCKFREV